MVHLQNPPKTSVLFWLFPRNWAKLHTSIQYLDDRYGIEDYQ